MLSKLKRDKYQDKYIISLIAAKCGLRLAEILGLTWNDVDFKTAAQLLGHNIEETMRTYSHVNDDMLNYAKKIIDKI